MKLIGLARLGRDAEIRNAGDDKVCNLSLAFNYGPKDSEGKQETTWVDAALWGKRAESLAPYLLKGTVHEFLINSVHLKEWESDRGSGVKLAGTVMDVQLGPKQTQQDSAPARAPAAQPKTHGPNNRPAATARPATGFDDMDDSIHF